MSGNCDEISGLHSAVGIVACRSHTNPFKTISRTFQRYWYAIHIKPVYALRTACTGFVRCQWRHSSISFILSPFKAILGVFHERWYTKSESSVSFRKTAESGFCSPPANVPKKKRSASLTLTLSDSFLLLLMFPN